jgi:hypothetical protein
MKYLAYIHKAAVAVCGLVLFIWIMLMLIQH